MTEQKLLQDPAIVRFLEQNKPKQRKNKLDKFKEYIFFLKARGYSDQQIANFLKTEKQFFTSQQSVNKFIRIRSGKTIQQKNVDKSVVVKSRPKKQVQPKQQDKFVIDDVPLSDLI